MSSTPRSRTIPCRAFRVVLPGARGPFGAFAFAALLGLGFASRATAGEKANEGPKATTPKAAAASKASPPKGATPKATTPKAVSTNAGSPPPVGGSGGKKEVAATGLVDPAVVPLVAKVQARYDGARDFTASFEQSLTNAATQRASRSAGKVTFKKGGKMRWDYTSPEARMVLADGSRLWLWEPEDRQAFRQELASSQLPAALAFLTGQGKLTDEFRVAPLTASPYGKPGQQVLSLEPKKPSAQVQRLVFVVDPASGFVHETVVFDSQGNANDLVFNDIKVNTGVADSLFAWTPPAGTRVIDPSAGH